VTIRYIVLSVWFAWIIVALILLFNAGSSTALISLYAVYLLFGTTVLLLKRKDLLSPPGIFTLGALVGFGLNIPLIVSGYLIPDRPISDDTMVKVLVVLLCANAGFMAGYLVKLHKLMPTNWIVAVKSPARTVGIGSYILLACWVLIAGFIRIRFHLGEAGIQPLIQSGYIKAGYIQYVLYEGVLILSLWYLSQALSRGSFYILLGISLLLGTTVIQALLAWRGGIAHILVLTIVLFWYEKKMYQKHNAGFFLWLVLPVLLLNPIIEYGNAIRVQRLGGDIKFTREDYARKLLMRSQGTVRLADVVDYFGPVTFTNNFFIVELSAKGLSTTKFIDQKVYGVLPRQSNSFGTSGPGGPYVAMGLVGVFLAYALLGGFYRSIYRNIFISRTGALNAMSVVWYALLTYNLLALLTENFNISNIKTFIAIAAQVYVYKLFLYKRHAARAVRATEPPYLIAAQRQLT